MKPPKSVARIGEASWLIGHNASDAATSGGLMQAMSLDEIAMLRASARRFARNRLVPLGFRVEADDAIAPARSARLRAEAAAPGFRRTRHRGVAT